MKTKNYSLLYGWLVCGLGAIFYCYEYLLRIEPNVMMPQIMSTFQLNATGFGILVSMYYLGYTPLQTFVGVLTDCYGPRRILGFAIACCVVGELIFGYVSNIYLVELGRFFMGVGSAFAFVGVLKLGAIWLPARYFARIAGLTTALGMIGAMLGDIGMSWLVQHNDWRIVILYGILFGAILTPLFLLFVQEKPPEQNSIQILENKLSFRELLIEFCYMCKNRQMIYIGIVGSLLFLSLSVFADLWGPNFIKAVTHLDIVAATRINTMIYIGWLIGAPLSGWLSDRLQKRRIFLIAGSVLSALMISIILLLPNLETQTLSILLFLFGLFSSVEIICFALGRDLYPVSRTATAMGFINLLIMLSALILQPLMGKLLDCVWSGHIDVVQNIRIYDVTTYRWVLAILPLLLLFSAGLAFFIKEKLVNQEVKDDNELKVEYQNEYGI